MRRVSFKRLPKRPVQVGDYVFASAWGDADPDDPWYVSFVEEIRDGRYKLEDSNRFYRYCRRISCERGKQILEEYPKMSRYKF